MKQLFTPVKRHLLQKVMAFFFLLILYLSCSPPLNAETDGLQELLENAESETGSEQLLELIEDLKKNRIPLNKADADELRQLPWLTVADAEAILNYRRNKGPILSRQELEPIIGKYKASCIDPYLQYEKQQSFSGKQLSKPLDLTLYSRFFSEIPRRHGIINGTYGGENYKLYNRLQLSTPHVKLSLLEEKDIGEPDIADFSSVSINFCDLGVIQSAVLGNYKLNVAQGLLIGQSRFYSKGSDPTGTLRLPSILLSPYTSSGETGFLQGAATTLKLDPFEITTFYSANHVDGIINKYGVITSFDQSGYHRAQYQISRKDNLVEKLYGASLLYHYQSGDLSGKTGGTVLSYRYPVPLDELEPDVIPSTISSSTLYSVQTDLTLGHASLFAEAALSSQPKDASWVAGVEFEPLQGLNTVAAFRCYGEHYYSPFAGAFAERGDGASNEKGLYLGLNARISDRLSLGAYHDRFTFPSLDTHCQYPSDGNDSRLSFTWRQSPTFTWSLQLQHKYKEEQSNQGSSSHPIWTPLPKISDRCRLDCDINLSTRIHLRSRGEVKKVVKQYLAADRLFNGWLIYQQAGYNTGQLSVKGRLTCFNTEDYDAAIYAYEDDLPLTSSLGVYDGRGKSFFLLATWQVMKQMKLAARYETTWYSDRTVSGSNVNDQRATSSPASYTLGCLLTF